MLRNWRFRTSMILFAICWVLSSTVTVTAQVTTSETGPIATTQTPIDQYHLGPFDAFDVNGPWPGLRRIDTILALRILHGQPGLMHRLPDGSKKIFWVKSASAQLVPGSKTLPNDKAYLQNSALDPSRWDLVLNGVVVDPREFEILYNERIFNLGALFTYAREFDPASQIAPWEITGP